MIFVPPGVVWEAAQDAVDTSDQPPTVEVTAVSPQFLPVGGGDVRIQATAHDDHAITQVYAVVTGPGGPTTVPMALFSPSDYEGFITIPANTLPHAVGYTVVAHVVRRHGPGRHRQRAVDRGRPDVPEQETPVISNVHINPSKVAADGGTVTISATITSSAGIASAGYTVYLNSGGQAGSTMTRTAPDSDVWSGDVAIPPNFSNDPINHTVDMSAEGNDGGSTLEIVGSIDQDGQPVFDQAPNVSITSIDPTELSSDGGNVTIQASADDDHSVSEVYVTLSSPEGFTTVYLVPAGGSGWQGSFTAPANTSRTTAVVYTTQATAIDDAGQSAFADGPAISVAPVPNQEPVVSSPSVAPVSLPATGGSVTIRADADDPDGTVAQVHADITRPDGSVITLTMSQPAADAPYEVDWTAPANTAEAAAEHVVSVAAVDNDGALGSADAGSVTVDGVPPFDESPDVFDTALTPATLPAPGGEVTIGASATDDRAVSEVYAVVTAPGGASSHVPMDPVSGSGYEGVFTVPANLQFAPSAYQVEVIALDDIGQQGSESAGTVTVAARVDQPPQVTGAAVVPATLAGGGLARIRATVTEDREMGVVYALVRGPDGIQTRVQMSAASGDTTYEGLFTAPENLTAGPVVYAVEVVAKDLAGLTGRASAGALTVTPAPPAVIGLRVSKSTLRFGRVQVGGASVRAVRLRHPGAPGSGAIILDLSVLGARFELTGPSSDLERLRLRPGQARKLRIAFQPRAAGKRIGQLLLARTDGDQPGLSVDLVGRGIRR